MTCRWHVRAAPRLARRQGVPYGMIRFAQTRKGIPVPSRAHPMLTWQLVRISNSLLHLHQKHRLRRKAGPMFLITSSFAGLEGRGSTQGTVPCVLISNLKHREPSPVLGITAFSRCSSVCSSFCCTCQHQCWIRART